MRTLSHIDNLEKREANSDVTVNSQVTLPVTKTSILNL